MFFPQSYAKLKDKLNIDALVTVHGKLSIRNGERPCVMVDSLTPWELKGNTTEVKEKSIKTLYLKYDISNIALHDDVYKTLNTYPGFSPVVVVDLNGNAFKLKVNVNPNSFLLSRSEPYALK